MATAMNNISDVVSRLQHNLQEFTLSTYLYSMRWTRFDSALRHSLQSVMQSMSLTTLSFKGVKDVPLGLLRLSPSIRKLFITDLIQHGQDTIASMPAVAIASPPLSLAHSPKLLSLTVIADDRGPNVNVLKSVVDSSQGPKCTIDVSELQYLNIQLEALYESQHLSAILGLCSRTLTHLSLTIPPSVSQANGNANNDIPINLSAQHLPQLRHLQWNFAIHKDRIRNKYTEILFTREPFQLLSNVLETLTPVPSAAASSGSRLGHKLPSLEVNLELRGYESQLKAIDDIDWAAFVAATGFPERKHEYESFKVTISFFDARFPRRILRLDHHHLAEKSSRIEAMMENVDLRRFGDALSLFDWEK
ncbi:hypothetical protein CVT24_007381 [Panaeolus cyanescens]|uniref:Uncharacterized protein n=1 Tax=Panaeolus cyanescens TaxID=181874 RepID=A0A409YKY5_9AGAR|nr:hypothetical protein CVT24_007381 [Panaeolus cyanescens]